MARDACGDRIIRSRPESITSGKLDRSSRKPPIVAFSPQRGKHGLRPCRTPAAATRRLKTEGRMPTALSMPAHILAYCGAAQGRSGLAILCFGTEPPPLRQGNGMSQLSQSIVDFIAGLLPLYTCQHADGHECALSLLDGTLILPVDESHAEQEEGWVAVFWQGDSRRRSEVMGTQLASVAAWRHVELHGVDRTATERALLRRRLAEQFHAGTGLSLQSESTESASMAITP